LITNAYNGPNKGSESGIPVWNPFLTSLRSRRNWVYKPDPSLFLYALNCVDIAPGKALYIGDSVAYDVVGAKTAGMEQCSLADSPKQ